MLSLFQGGHCMNRRRIITRVLEENESVMSITCFPQLGVADYFTPINNDGISRKSLSYSFPDVCTSSFPRFGYDLNISFLWSSGLTENIRLRRKRKIDIQVPIYKDTNTDLEAIHQMIGLGNSFLLENEQKKQVNEVVPVVPDPVDGQIHMDAMGYGMGLSCLQVSTTKSFFMTLGNLSKL